MASRAIKPQAYRPRHRRAWAPRHDRRRIQPTPSFPEMLTGLAALRRAELSKLAQRVIDRLDDMDRDPDLEDDDLDHCLAADEGCGAIIIDGRTYWGSDVEELGC